VLHNLREVLGEQEVTPCHLNGAFEALRHDVRLEPEIEPDAFVELTHKTFLVGVMAAASAPTNENLADFRERLAEWRPSQDTVAHLWVIIRSCRHAEGRPVLALLQHPLLKCAAQRYASNAAEPRRSCPFSRTSFRASVFRAKTTVRPLTSR
jgi:hypothetical protein